MPITVLIADGKASVRTACAKILKPEKGIRVVGDAASGPAGDVCHGALDAARRGDLVR